MIDKYKFLRKIGINENTVVGNSRRAIIANPKRKIVVVPKSKKGCSGCSRKKRNK